jgi:hypothetical protein
MTDSEPILIARANRVLTEADVYAMVKYQEYRRSKSNSVNIHAIRGLRAMDKLGWFAPAPPTIDLTIYSPDEELRHIQVRIARANRNSLTFAAPGMAPLRSPDLRQAVIIMPSVPPVGYKAVVMFDYFNGVRWLLGEREAASVVTGNSSVSQEPPLQILRREIRVNHAIAQMGLWYTYHVRLFGVLGVAGTPTGAIARGRLDLRDRDYVLMTQDRRETFLVPPAETAEAIYMTLDLLTGEGGIEMAFPDCLVTLTDRLMTSASVTSANRRDL